jgi:hypothetical protein
MLLRIWLAFISGVWGPSTGKCNVCGTDIAADRTCSGS